MGWIPIAAWGVAAAVAVVVLGFCAYELLWKLKRLRADIAGLTALADEFEQLSGGLTEAQRRLAASGLG